MLGILTIVTLALGVSWLADYYFEFRIGGLDFLYPFDLATRQIAGHGLLAASIILAWLERRHVQKTHHW